ncbi:KH domain-containing protein isoform X1 [Gossypium australe]|uniref:KH domain-containing protein isoform X1 n=1 Tax=Gossypium australe TaxID=47621 RepID=A0A5B6WF17_9ROSI|nr:KH domain-containing protein isoform X1 [Gossypium australe]
MERMFIESSGLSKNIWNVTKNEASKKELPKVHEESEADQGPREREHVDDDLKNIKLSIPPFHDKSDPETYLEWEKKIELVFECHNYSESKKMKLTVTEFSDYAMIWWD